MNNINKYLKKVASGLTYLMLLVLMLVIIVNLVMVFQSFTSPNELPQVVGYKLLIAKTDSMAPVIDPGDLVIVRAAPADSLKQNEIVAFRVDEAILVQRIEQIDDGKTERELFTQADRPGYDSFDITEEALEGRLVLRIPRLGDFMIFLQSPMGTMIFVLIPLLVLFILYSISAGKKADKEKSDGPPEETTDQESPQ